MCLVDRLIWISFFHISLQHRTHHTQIFPMHFLSQTSWNACRHGSGSSVADSSHFCVLFVSICDEVSGKHRDCVTSASESNTSIFILPIKVNLRAVESIDKREMIVSESKHSSWKSYFLFDGWANLNFYRFTSNHTLVCGMEFSSANPYPPRFWLLIGWFFFLQYLDSAHVVGRLFKDTATTAKEIRRGKQQK